MKKPSPGADVSAYLAALPPAQRKVLAALRKTIRAALPKAEERISYGIPGYYQNGAVVFFAAWSKHLSLYPLNAGMKAALGPALARHEVRGSTLRFSVEKPLSAALVKRIIKIKLGQQWKRKAS